MPSRLKELERKKHQLERIANYSFFRNYAKDGSKSGRL
jgi:hypothetical protein